MCNTGSGHTFRFSYDFISNSSNASPVFDAPTTYANAASALVLGGNSTGIAGQITGATGNYNLKGSNNGVAEELHLLYSTDSLKVLGCVGAKVRYINHKGSYNFTQLSDGSQSQNTQTEQMILGGPTSALFITKHFGADFSLYGMFRFTAHAANVQHTSVAKSVTGTVDNGYTVNSQGSVNRLFNEEEVTLGIGWNHQFSGGSIFSASADWSGGFTGDSTVLFSSTSGTQAGKPQGIIYGLLKGALHFTF